MSRTNPSRTRRLALSLAIVSATLIAGCGTASDAQQAEFDPVADGRGLEPAWWETASVQPPSAETDPVAPADDEKWLEVRVPADVLFALDSDTVEENGRRVLGHLVDDVQLSQAREITVAGATDSTGTFEYNLDLSQRRAEAATAELVAHGVDASVITIEAWADTRPVLVEPDLDEETARSLQRRVEIRALLPAAIADRLRSECS